MLHRLQTKSRTRALKTQLRKARKKIKIKFRRSWHQQKRENSTNQYAAIIIMESTRKRKRKETLFRPPRNVRKYLDRQIVTIAYSSVSGCQLLLQPWVPWAPKTDGKWPAQLIGNRAHFLITSQALEKERK